MTVVVVGLGGAFGAVLRYVVSTRVQAWAGDAFPWGTFTVNVVGSLILGFALVWLQAHLSSNEMKQLVTVGFLGSFTTFSTFSLEAMALFEDGAWTRGGAYIAGSVLMGLAAVALGMTVASALTQTNG